MKESAWGYMIISLGIVLIVILLLVQRLTTTNEEEYYLGREILEASMLDAIDYGTYRATGEIVMSREKFIEVFTKRFANSVSGSNSYDYRVEFFDINEYPPKASVMIRTKTGATEINSDGIDIDVVSLANGILEVVDEQYSIMFCTKNANVKNEKCIAGQELKLNTVGSSEYGFKLEIPTDGIMVYAKGLEKDIVDNYKVTTRNFILFADVEDCDKGLGKAKLQILENTTGITYYAKPAYLKCTQK